MTDATPIELVFRTWQKKDGAYTHTYVSITRKYREQIVAVRDGAIDNRDGYGSDEAAQYWLDACEQMLGDGHDAVYRSSASGASIMIRWQHSGTYYCQPDFEHMGREFSEIESSTKLLRQIGKKIERARLRQQIKLGNRSKNDSPNDVGDWTFRDPDHLLAVLRTMNDATEIEELRVGPDSWHTVDVPKRKRPAGEYTLVGAHSPGMQVSA